MLLLAPFCYLQEMFLGLCCTAQENMFKRTVEEGEVRASGNNPAQCRDIWMHPQRLRICWRMANSSLATERDGFNEDPCKNWRVFSFTRSVTPSILVKSDAQATAQQCHLQHHHQHLRESVPMAVSIGLPVRDAAISGATVSQSNAVECQVGSWQF